MTMLQRGLVSLLYVLGILCCPAAADKTFAGEEKILIFPFEARGAGDIVKIRNALPTLLPSRLSIPGRLQPHMAGAGQPGAAPSAGQDTLAQAKRLNADYVLTGSIAEAGGGIRLAAQLTEVAAGSRQTPLQVQAADKNAIIARVGSLCSQVTKIILAKDAPAPPPPDYAAAHSARPVPPQKAPAGAQPATIMLPPPAAAAPGDGGGQAEKKPATYLAVPEQPARLSGTPCFKAQPVLSYIIKSTALTVLAAGDVNGDGRSELLLGGPEALYIYTMGPGGSLAPAHNIPVRATERLVHLDAGDFNGNGIDEIYISSYDGSSANSFVVEYGDGGYRRVAENLPWFFRSYAPPVGAACLIGQEAWVGNPFAGDIRRMTWKDGAPSAGDKMKLPVVCSIYGFAEADIDRDGSAEFFVFQRGMFDAALKLSALTPQGKTLWKDTYGLGATAVYFKRSVSLSESGLKEPVPMRVLFAADDSGRPCMIVGKNAQKGDSFFSFLIKSTQGAACCLVWNGSAFAPNWTSEFSKDFVADYLLADADADGSPELFVLGVTGDLDGSFAMNKIQVFRQR